ncbi:hypothetical protein ACH4HG_22675 [Streptomyces coeruleorubidus]|nr:hypothetical protein [Streptomyces sp. 35G-GA-8]MCL7382621.1 hypothetical protein [Streptomyces sp. 35G-GA-8]
MATDQARRGDQRGELRVGQRSPTVVVRPTADPTAADRDVPAAQLLSA